MSPLMGLEEYCTSFFPRLFVVRPQDVTANKAADDADPLRSTTGGIRDGGDNSFFQRVAQGGTPPSEHAPQKVGDTYSPSLRL
jgi:hypothetical protein